MKIERVNIKRNGVKISERQVANIIRKELHLSKNKYQKLYDITRNKLRNYERTTGAKPQSTLQFLYNRAQFKARLRSENKSLIEKGEQPLRYRKSYKTQFIESFSSRSSGKTIYGKLEQEHINKETEKHINKVYGDLIEKNEYAKKIFENKAFIDKDTKKRDYTKILKALNKYTDKRNDREIKKDRRGRTSNLPFGSSETVGTNGSKDKTYFDDIIKEFGGSSL